MKEPEEKPITGRPFEPNPLWLRRMRADPRWGKIRFKHLPVEQPKFTIPSELVDYVDLEEFRVIESDRLPLFIGSQIGIHPSLPEKLPAHLPARFFAIQAISIFNRSVAAMTICTLEGGVWNKFCVFDNRE